MTNMSAAYFYVEYRDGRYVEKDYPTVLGARRAYAKFSKNVPAVPLGDVVGYGWEVRRPVPLLSEQIRRNRGVAQ